MTGLLRKEEHHKFYEGNWPNRGTCLAWVLQVFCFDVPDAHIPWKRTLMWLPEGREERQKIQEWERSPNMFFFHSLILPLIPFNSWLNSRWFWWLEQKSVGDFLNLNCFYLSSRDVTSPAQFSADRMIKCCSTVDLKNAVTHMLLTCISITWVSIDLC